MHLQPMGPHHAGPGAVGWLTVKCERMEARPEEEGEEEGGRVILEGQGLTTTILMASSTASC